MHYTLTPLKDLLEYFYIDEISKALTIEKSMINYESSDQVIINSENFNSLKTNKERKLIYTDAEKRLTTYLSTFKCSKNDDVEKFIKEQSISFHKKNLSKTFLYIDESNNIIGYFTLAVKTLYVKETLSNRIRKICNAKKSEDDNCHAINTFLIGQIGRDDRYRNEDINLDDFFTDIFKKLNTVRSIVGCPTILIEVDNEDKLIALYKEYDFEYLQKDDSGLSQLWYLSIDY